MVGDEKVKPIKKTKKGEVKNILDQDASKIEDKKLANYIVASQKYRDHVNNTPTVPSNASLGEKIANRFAVMKHNLMAPDNPNLMGGTVGNGLLGGRGLGKIALKLTGKLFDKYRNL